MKLQSEEKVLGLPSSLWYLIFQMVCLLLFIYFLAIRETAAGIGCFVLARVFIVEHMIYELHH